MIYPVSTLRLPAKKLPFSFLQNNVEKQKIPASGRNRDLKETYIFEKKYFSATSVKLLLTNNFFPLHSFF